ncbi:uncharacterized protein [Haliotis asinina]|uniref:uncharacterized protein n=1 Tax=Haliotis asinina TaxID=109174 RepID=UPI0035327060
MLRVFIVMVITMVMSSAVITPTSDMNPICSTTTETLIPHPTDCAQYYNCSAPAKTFYSYLREKNLQECPYPQLYNTDTRRCEHYSMVKCGNKFEPLGVCEYKNICYGGRYCWAPCHVYNPSCRNLSDGLNVYEYRIKSTYFVVCVNQRLVYKGQCPDLGKGRQRFDPTLRACRYF